MLVIIIVQPVHAGLFSSIGNFFEGLRDQVRDELDRTRVGRELNRVIEDLEAVGELANEFSNLIELAGSATTPLGIANLAIQYGHNPDMLFDRFQERINTLNNQESLSNTEAAAVLQSVLEEPPLPQGVYMGDECVIDFSNCPDESENSQPRYRAHYWDYSCYVKGNIDKKIVNGIKTAACLVNWINTYSGNTANVKFPIQSGIYEWETCAQIYLTQTEIDNYLAQKVCAQPIAKHDLGEVCVVDYSSCNNDPTALYNSNRVGTINYGLVRQQNHRREYGCEITYGTYALKPELRQSCETVYVGSSEVREFLSNNPEPTQPVVPVPIQQSAPPQNTNPPVILPGFRRQSNDVIYRLSQASEQDSSDVFGKTGIVNLNKDIQQKKAINKDKLTNLGVDTSFDEKAFEDSFNHLEIPDNVKKYLGNEKIFLSIKTNFEVINYCLTIIDGDFSEIKKCSEMPELTLHVQITDDVFNNLQTQKDVKSALDDGRISYKSVGLMKKVKHKLIVSLLGAIS